MIDPLQSRRDQTIFQCPREYHHSALNLGIRLDKNTYEAGETVNGTLFTQSDKTLKLRKLKFSVYGKERYKAGMSGGMSTAGITNSYGP
jgi:hypothetical protein